MEMENCSEYCLNCGMMDSKKWRFSNACPQVKAMNPSIIQQSRMKKLTSDSSASSFIPTLEFTEFDLIAEETGNTILSLFESSFSIFSFT